MVHNCVCCVLAFVLLLAGTAWSDSLVANWELDEGSGSIASDSSANSNAGTLQNMDSNDWVTGLDGTALDFDGVNDYVQVPDDSSLSFGTGSFSISLWIKCDPGTVGMLAVNGTSGGGYTGKRYGLYTSGDDVFFLVDDNATLTKYNTGDGNTAGGVLDDSNWHHITAVRDRAADRMRIYVDAAVLVNGVDNTENSIDSPGEDFHIGRNGVDLDNGYFNGLMDKIRVYDYALSQAEIDNLASWSAFPYAWNPSPAHRAAVEPGVPVTLTWSAGVGAVSHDVYFGTSETAVANAMRLAGDIDGDGTVALSDLITLAEQWLGSGTEPYADVDGDGNVNVIDFAVVSADWSDTAESVFKGNQAATSYDAGILAVDQTYYWRVDEVNGGDSQSPRKGQTWSVTTIEPIINIMPLGDSITQGGSNYRYYLWHKLQNSGYTNINFVGSHDVLGYDTYDSLVFDKDHEGHGGWTTDQIRDGGGTPAGGTGDLNIWLTGLQATNEVPDIVLMHLGTNDVNAGGFGYDHNITIGEMEDVIDILRSYNPNVTVLVAKVIPCTLAGFPGMDALNALIPGLDTYETAASEVIIVDHNTGFLSSWLADGTHPNATGSNEMSNRWYSMLAPVLSDSPVANWNFNEGTGSVAYDSSANNNTGTLHNMDAGDWVTAPDGTALDFDGVNDYVQVPDDSSLSFGTGSFSIALWIKCDPGTVGMLIVNGTSGGGYTGKKYAVYISGDDVFFVIDDNVTMTKYNTGDGNTAGGVLDDGNWHHITAVRDRAVDRMRIYVDAVELVNEVDNTENSIDSPGEDFHIGRNGVDLDNGYFDGLMDNIRVYDYILPQAEIDNLAL